MRERDRFPGGFPRAILASGHHSDPNALRKQGKSVGYYSSAAGSYGLQAGVQSFGYALLLMSDPALFGVGVATSVLAFLLAGFGMHTTQTAGLALGGARSVGGAARPGRRAGRPEPPGWGPVRPAGRFPSSADRRQGTG